MKDIVTNNKQNILLIIVIVLAAWNIFTTNGIKTDVKLYKEKIESIQTEIDSAKAVNEGIDIKIFDENFKIVSRMKSDYAIYYTKKKPKIGDTAMFVDDNHNIINCDMNK
jgi:hypothetical protein